MAQDKTSTPASPKTGLKIAVIEGEDAVNVVEQKTAVARRGSVRSPLQGNQFASGF